MFNHLITSLALFFSLASFGQNLPPVAETEAQTNLVTNQLYIYFNLTDAENDVCRVDLVLFDENSVPFSPEAADLEGDFGPGIFPGNDKQIVWNFPIGIPILDYQVKLVVSDDQPFDLSVLVPQVDTIALQSDMEFLCSGIRNPAVDPSHFEAVRDLLENRFQQFTDQAITQDFTFSGINGQNILGIRQGAVAPNNLVIVDAHYDAVTISPGADDNASGVIGVLELAKILSQYEFEKSILFAGFDKEEVGLLGSNFLVGNQEVLNGREIENVLNMEMIGYYSDQPGSQEFPVGFNLLFPEAHQQVVDNGSRGDFLTVVANAASTGLMNTFDSLSAILVPELKRISIATPGNGEITPDLRRSDHASFWDGGYPALMLTDASEFRNPNYHTPFDVPDSLNFRFINNNLQAMLVTTAHLAGILHGSSSVADVVYNETAGIKYPSSEDVLKVYPNPASEAIQVDWKDHPPGQKQATIMDIKGRITGEFIFSSFPASIHTESLDPGVYWILVREKSNETPLKRAKFIKAK